MATKRAIHSPSHKFAFNPVIGPSSSTDLFSPAVVELGGPDAVLGVHGEWQEVRDVEGDADPGDDATHAPRHLPRAVPAGQTRAAVCNTMESVLSKHTHRHSLQG